MNQLLNKILSKDQAMLVDLVEWYNDCEFNIPSSTFIEMNIVYQLPIIAEYIRVKYNIYVVYDRFSYMLCWDDISEKIAQQDILKRLEDKVEYTNAFDKQFGLEEAQTMLEAYNRAVNAAIDAILTPF